MGVIVISLVMSGIDRLNMVRSIKYISSLIICLYDPGWPRYFSSNATRMISKGSWFDSQQATEIFIHSKTSRRSWGLPGFFLIQHRGPTSGLKMTATNNMGSVYTLYKKYHLCFVFWGKKCLRVGRFSGKSVTIFRTRQVLTSFGTPNILRGILWFSSIFREGCCILPRSGYHVFLAKLPSSKLPFPATLSAVKWNTTIFALLHTRS